MSYIEALILAIVEGITEFLPISSTGHMIITSSLLGIASEEFTKVYTVHIQFGAILSVFVLYFRRFFQTIDFYKKLFVAFLPAAVIGLLVADYIDMLLENVMVVAIMLLLGGIFLLFVDRIFASADKNLDHLNFKRAFIIGFYQCIAMIPGTSRSAATIVGGMALKLNRKAAAEFSFFLAVPTMFAAGFYKLLKDYEKISMEDLEVLLFGNVIAFLVAMAAIRFFITYLTKYGFKLFGWYRIILGLAILILMAMGYDLQVV